MLARSPHHQEVARRQEETLPGAPTAGSQPEAARAAERDYGDEWIHLRSADPVGVPCNGVVAVAVVVDPDGVECLPVPMGQPVGDVVDNRWSFGPAELDAGTEAGVFDKGAVHGPAPP